MFGSLNKLHEDGILDSFPNLGASSDAHLRSGPPTYCCSGFQGEWLDAAIYLLGEPLLHFPQIIV